MTSESALTSALTSAVTSAVWRCAPCVCCANAMPSVLTSDFCIWGHMGPYGYGYRFFSFRGGRTRALGIGWHTDTPRGSKWVGEPLTPSGKNSEQHSVNSVQRAHLSSGRSLKTT
jgi:hypothetical protein